MHKNLFIPAIVGIALCSCVSQFEAMSKGTESGDHYVYHYGQVGGQGTGQSSMGTSVGFDGQKSLADVIQGWVTRGASLDFVKTNSSNNAVKMHKEGEITTRQLAEFQKELGLAETAPEVITAAKALPK